MVLRKEGAMETFFKPVPFDIQFTTAAQAAPGKKEMQILRPHRRLTR